MLLGLRTVEGFGREQTFVIETEIDLDGDLDWTRKDAVFQFGLEAVLVDCFAGRASTSTTKNG